MNHHTNDQAVVRLFEQSVIVRFTEHAAARLARLARASMLVGLASLFMRRASPHGGIVVLAAVVTHLLLMTAVARPVAGYWLILPASFGAIAVLLLALKARRPR